MCGQKNKSNTFLTLLNNILFACIIVEQATLLLQHCLFGIDIETRRTYFDLNSEHLEEVCGKFPAPVDSEFRIKWLSCPCHLFHLRSSSEIIRAKLTRFVDISWNIAGVTFICKGGIRWFTFFNFASFI